MLKTIVGVGTFSPPFVLWHLSTFATPWFCRFSRISSSGKPSRSGHQMTPLLVFLLLWAETLIGNVMKVEPLRLINISDTLALGQSTIKMLPSFQNLPTSWEDTPSNHFPTVKILHFVSGLSGMPLSTTKNLGTGFGGWGWTPRLHLSLKSELST